MKNYILSLLLIIGSNFQLSAQCLTDFTKLLPEPSTDYSLNFGASISMYENYLAVGVPNSDSLGRITGLVIIYEKINNLWVKVATMAPSDPLDAQQFGTSVKLSKDYLLVACNPGGTGGGKVYLFKKSISGWTSGTELGYFKETGTSYFGVGYNAGVIEISENQNTIIIADPFYRGPNMPSNSSGALFVYHKTEEQDWESKINPTAIITAPETDVQDFGRSGVAYYEDRIITATPYAPTANGAIYIFKDVSNGALSSFEREARLVSGPSSNSYFLGMNNIIANADGIFTSAVLNIEGSNRFGIIFFARPTSGVWNDSEPTCLIDPDGDFSTPNNSPLIIAKQGESLVVTVRDDMNRAFLIKLRKSSGDWCNPQRELIDTYDLGDPTISHKYGSTLSCNETNDIVLGLVPLPNNSSANLAIKTFSNTSGIWQSQLLYSSKMSTAGHYFGRQLLGFDEFLFVTAPYDGTVKSNSGAVYCYKKSSAGWGKTGRILPPQGQQYDDVFGSALASNKAYLAVAAFGHEPHGKIFMYKKESDDWSSVDLVQEIQLPEDLLPGIFQYGDYLAMSDEWLVIPYIQNSPARIFLTFYKFNGLTWDYKQALELMNANFFARYSTVAVAIENDIVVAGQYIVERNSNDVWEKKYVLSPSDKENQRISPDFKYWITNGDSFGSSVAIHDNTIFIGAPTKDYDDIWDVGAVYVYTKDPDASWSSRTETTKLVPRVKEERELFGYSLHSLYNTLIVGSPGSDYNKDGVTARNKPGRSYVFQAEDFFWETVTPLMDFTGDSFIKDYYGLAVYMDQTDFFIGAAIEDIENAKLSGSVYVTPTPPILKLVAPVCITNGTHDLFGYPFGGVWSGPGIVDAQAGIIDLNIAGVGTHVYTYITPSCTYPGKLRIRIDPPPLAILTTNTQYEVCTNTTNINYNLGVQPQQNCYYLWYYREKEADEFESLEIRSTTMFATRRGEYRVRVYNQSCETYSPIIRIVNEVIDFKLTVPEELCSTSEAISLAAEPPGGQWSGSGILGNKFNPASLNQGSYKIFYNYSSPRGCKYQIEKVIKVFQGFTANVGRISGDLCVEGFVTIGVASNIPQGASITWLFQKNLEEQYNTTGEITPSITITEHGYYSFQAVNGVCESVSQPFKIDDKLILTTEPAGDLVNICYDQEFTIRLMQQDLYNIDWFYYPDENASVQMLNSSETLISPKETGYYYARASRGVCQASSIAKKIIIHPRDSIFVPNIFTPNNDAYNDAFKVVTTSSQVSMLVIDRYGKTIFSGNGITGWDGGESPSGVYFWVVMLSTCMNESLQYKGWVQLIR